MPNACGFRLLLLFVAALAPTASGTCAAGSYLSSGACTLCPLGTYSAAGANFCTACAYNEFTPFRGSSSCSSYDKILYDTCSPVRYVRISQAAVTYLNFVELVVLNASANVAKGKPASQSSTYIGSGSCNGDQPAGPNSASYALDENLCTYADTDSAANNWWEVDLLAEHVITSTVFFNRVSYADRINGAVISFSDAALSVVASVVIPATAPSSYAIGLCVPCPTSYSCSSGVPVRNSDSSTNSLSAQSTPTRSSIFTPTAGVSISGSSSAQQSTSAANSAQQSTSAAQSPSSLISLTESTSAAQSPSLVASESASTSAAQSPSPFASIPPCPALPGFSCPSYPLGPSNPAYLVVAPCSPSTYCVGGNSQSMPCTAAPGYFCGLASSTGAGAACPENYACLGNVAQPVACPPGSSSPPGAALCGPIIPGSPQFTPASVAPVVLGVSDGPQVVALDALGAPTQQDAAAIGKQLPIILPSDKPSHSLKSSTTRTPASTPTATCRRGHARVAGNSICTACPAGTHQLHNACVRCPVQTYNSFSGQTTCLPCPPGRKASPGQKICK
jgi:hypothetical protein